MKLRTLAIALLFAASPALAADHIDSPAATGEPGADITDHYAWMSSDAQHLNLVMAVNPFATPDSVFSDAALYAFHVGSSMGYGEEEQMTGIICRFFDAATLVECWAGDEYLVGDPSDPAGITSDSGHLRVFAGLRNDPFFFELVGFQNAVDTVTSVASSLDFDVHGCPTVDADTSAALVGMLQSGADGAEASNTLAGANVLALVVQVDKSVVTPGGPLLSTWVSTHQMAQ